MAERSFDLLIKGGTLVLPDGIRPGDVGVVAGRIAAIGALAEWPRKNVFQADGLHVLPGVIDSQVHFREPGSEHKEDLASGTAAAAMGGVTAIFEMPNTTPPTTTTAALDDKLRRARGRAWVDHAFFVGAAADNVDQLGQLETHPGCCGVKIFMGSSTGSLLLADDETLEKVLRSGQCRVAVHAEDEARLVARHEIAVNAADPAAHPEWRDVESAAMATRRIIALSARTGRPVHVLHITTADEMALLRQAPPQVSVECTPQHLTLVAPDCYDQLGTLAQMNPPIRTTAHRDGLWDAIRDGTVDMVGSDHAPHTRDEKSRPYPESPSGMPGVQTLLPIMLDHVHAGRLTLERLVDLIAGAPARLYDARGKGSLRVGNDADFSIVDLGAKRTIEERWIVSKCGWTPFAGRAVTGWPIATIVRGIVVMRDDGLVGTPQGQPISFGHTSHVQVH